jgi:hypothetical protein
MPFYLVGYHTHEDSGQIMLEHVRAVSDDQLAAMVKNVLPAAARRYAATRPEGDGPVERLTFDSLHEPVAELLVERHGFRRVEFAASFSAFGWSDLLECGSWDGATDDLADTLAAAAIVPPVPPQE